MNAIGSLSVCVLNSGVMRRVRRHLELHLPILKGHYADFLLNLALGRRPEDCDACAWVFDAVKGNTSAEDEAPVVTPVVGAIVAADIADADIVPIPPPPEPVEAATHLYSHRARVLRASTISKKAWLSWSIRPCFFILQVDVVGFILGSAPISLQSISNPDPSRRPPATHTSLAV